jgi:sterol 3beta-glucosyltransferase
MKILIPTIGSRGDIQPYIALGSGLQKAGYDVTFATHPTFRSLVEFHGLKYAPFGPDIDLGVDTAKLRENKHAIDGGFIKVMKYSFDLLERSHDDLMELVKDADLVIITHTSTGSIEAEMLGKRIISGNLFAQIIPIPRSKQTLVEKTIGRAMGSVIGLFMTRPLNQLRKKYGMPPLGEQGVSSLELNLIASSPHITPPDPRWEPRHKMTGYWFSPEPENWLPPKELVKFLDSGDKPVVVSLGAMSLSQHDAGEMVELMVETATRAQCRMIIQGWEKAIAATALPDNVIGIGSIPHGWLLPRCAAIVHHGGFGTTAAGFRAGIPQIVIPHIIDQYVWGNLVAKRGLGPKPISRGKLSMQNLSPAIHSTLEDRAMSENAAKVGELIRSEDGVGNAVRLIQELLAGDSAHEG